MLESKQIRYIIACRGYALKNSKKGFKRIIWAFLFSLAGLKVCFKEEWAFRVVVLCFIIFGFLAYFLAHDFVEFTLLCLPLFLMVFAEIANTAIEKIIDLVSPGFHPLAREAKDIGSSLQFVSLVFAAIVWFVFLLKKFVL